MRKIELEVTNITQVASSQLVTSIGEKATRGARYEVIELATPSPEGDDFQIRIGNMVGRYHADDGIKIMITDPEMFGRFKMGQRIALG
jgi:hypothetical protein